MMCFGHSVRSIALFMALVMTAVSMPVHMAGAAMVSSEQVIEEVASADDRLRVMDFMARTDVRQQMIDLGIDPEEAARRAASLTDAEIQQIAGKLDQLQAGQGSLIGALVGAILIIFLVLLITDLLGLTDVFPFIKSQRA